MDAAVSSNQHERNDLRGENGEKLSEKPDRSLEQYLKGDRPEYCFATYESTSRA